MGISFNEIVINNQFLRMVLLLVIDVKYFNLRGVVIFFFGSSKIGNGQTKLSFRLKLLTALSISRGKFGLIFDFLGTLLEN